MPKIAIDASPGDFLKSSLVYGVSRAGKTVLSVTFPRPAIFTSAREGGYQSIQTMDRSLWYEPDVEPIIYAVSKISETLPFFREVEALAKKGRVRTVAVEITFYADDVIKAVARETDSKDSWAKWRLLDDHINWLVEATKRLGLRITLNALAADPGGPDSRAPGGIQVPGKAIARKLPAMLACVGYLRTEPREVNQIDRVLHLVPFGDYPAGHWYGSRLPPIVRNPTFRKLEDLFAGRARADDSGNVLYGEEAAALAASAGAGTSISASNGQDPAADLPPL